jgi:hypothetical protein
VATILSFVRARDRGFDEETTRIMGEAFDAACTLFSDPSQSFREAIADRIIDAAAEASAIRCACAMRAWPD